MTVIPGTGNLWVFVRQAWAILNQNTALEVEVSVTNVVGCRTGDAIGAGVLLPMKAGATAAATKAEYIIFGGRNYNYHF